MPGRPNDIIHRLTQGMEALKPAPIPSDRDAVLAGLLSPEQASAFRELPPFDQAHLLAVHDRLTRAGITDRDLLAAGLLHDLGKRDEFGVAALPGRAGQVLLRRFAPDLLRRLAEPPSQGWRHGLHLAVHHPRLGAARADALRCSERTVWLIAHHEDVEPIDPDLIQLQAADRG